MELLKERREGEEQKKKNQNLEEITAKTFPNLVKSHQTTEQEAQ